MRETVSHTFEAFVPEEAAILILGTMPSPKSRELGFYYGHPQNRFWKTLAGVFGESVPMSIDEKKDFLRRHRIALWDTLARCEIRGADDSSIRNPIPNDIGALLQSQPIKAIFTTGSKAAAYYRKLIYPSVGLEAVPLPSPSAANCRFYTPDSLIAAYRVIREYTD